MMTNVGSVPIDEVLGLSRKASGPERKPDVELPIEQLALPEVSLANGQWTGKSGRSGLLALPEVSSANGQWIEKTEKVGQFVRE